jgi:hypothetical protein
MPRFLAQPTQKTFIVYKPFIDMIIPKAILSHFLLPL